MVVRAIMALHEKVDKQVLSHKWRSPEERVGYG